MITLLDEQKLNTLRTLVTSAPKGTLIEVGVYKGGSLLEIAKLANGRHVIGFDTFKGMPSTYYESDEFHKPGEFNDTSFDAVSDFLDEHQVNRTLVEGLFPHSARHIDLKEIAFAHLDMDHWRGTLAALDFIWPRLMVGGIVLFDDYNWERCPGIAPLVNAWVKAKDIKEFGVFDNQAWIIK